MGVRINGVWHEELADPGTGGSDSGNGRNYTTGSDYNSAAKSTTFSGGTNTTIGSGGGGAATPAVTTGGGAAALDAQYQKMLAALASGNREAFEWEKQKFNQQFAESKRQFDIGRDDSLAQFTQKFGLDVASVTGMYNGQQTEQARQFDINAQQTATRDQAGLGTSLLNAATQLRGPRDYLQYQQLTRGGQNLMQQLYGGQQIPQGGAPAGQLQSANLGNALQDIGWYPQGQPQQQQQGANPTAQLLQRFGLSQGGGQQLLPNQIDPARWDAMGQIGQDLTKNLAETQYGYDATDFENQINKTRPIGTAARTTRSTYGQPRGLY